MYVFAYWLAIHLHGLTALFLDTLYAVHETKMGHRGKRLG
jgi:hypothetical protein